MLEKERDKLIIIGASGHGKVCADIAKLMGFKDIVFLDDNPELTHCGRYPVVGSSLKAFDIDGDIFVAVGSNGTRKRIIEKLPRERIVSLIHPSAVIADTVTIGDGTAIMAGAVINSDVVIGRGCIINTCSSIDHDSHIGDFVHISVGSHIAGTVRVGDNSFLCAGSIVKNNLSICCDTTVGAGAVVVKDIAVKGTYIGVPARQMGGGNYLEHNIIPLFHVSVMSRAA